MASLAACGATAKVSTTLTGYSLYCSSQMIIMLSSEVISLIFRFVIEKLFHTIMFRFVKFGKNQVVCSVATGRDDSAVMPGARVCTGSAKLLLRSRKSNERS